MEAWTTAPEADGLYDPRLEKEACGVGFVVNIDGVRSNKVCFIFYSVQAVILIHLRVHNNINTIFIMLFIYNINL